MKETIIELKKETEWISGVGLHSGENCALKIIIKESGHGIKFTRIDQKKSVIIPCDVRFVVSSDRSIKIEKEGISINTIEHLVSALVGLGINNALIEVNGPEIPILDGSSIQFCHALSKLKFESDDSSILHVQEHISYLDPVSGAEYLALPYDGFKVDVILDYDHPKIGQQSASFEGDSKDYISEIAGNRTFVLAHDLAELIDKKLIKGGQISNAIILFNENDDINLIKNAVKKLKNNDIDFLDKIKSNNFELRNSNEFARHKVLDLMGDLRLCGAKIKGHIIAKKPGHTPNVAFAKMLKQQLVKQNKLKGKPLYNVNQTPLYDVEGIKALLPHRYPFLFVDKIIELSKEHVVGIKNITINEQIFNGHFPENPVFPGVLQMEALAQTGGILALNTVENPKEWDTYFLKMDNVKFKKIIVPGDTMILKLQLLSPIRRGIFHMQGTVYVGDHIASEGELVAQIIRRRQ